MISIIYLNKKESQKTETLFYLSFMSITAAIEAVHTDLIFRQADGIAYYVYCIELQ